MVLNFELKPIHTGLFSFLRPEEGFGVPLYDLKAAQDTATKTKQNNVLVIYNSYINMLQGRILNKDCTASKGGIVLSNNRINTRMRLLQMKGLK